MLGAARPVLGAFAWYQHHRAQSGAVPLIELSVFAKRSYTAGVLFVVVFFGAVVGFSLSVGLFLQLGLRYSPLGASLAMLAWAIGAFVGTAFGSIMTPKLGRHIVHFGLTLMAAGLLGLYLVFALAGGSLTGWTMVGPNLLFGIGMGMIFAPLFDIILSGVEDREVGTASGLLESFQSLGASLGVAVLGTVFFSGLGAQADVQQFVDAALRVTALTIGLTVVAFGCAFLLPRTARGLPPQS
jgi:predicted MFS family arabinose efflux permease